MGKNKKVFQKLGLNVTFLPPAHCLASETEARNEHFCWNAVKAKILYVPKKKDHFPSAGVLIYTSHLNPCPFQFELLLSGIMFRFQNEMKNLKSFAWGYRKIQMPLLLRQPWKSMSFHELKECNLQSVENVFVASEKAWKRWLRAGKNEFQGIWKVYRPLNR